MDQSHWGAADEETITWDDVPVLMDELRAMARSLLVKERNAQSLQPTALVLTALRRQKPSGTDWGQVTWANRRHFFGDTHKAMRQALVDHARKRKRKRAVRTVQVEELQLQNLARTADKQPEVIDALFLALDRMRARHPEWVELVEHRYFLGFTIEQTARFMELAEKTIRRWWQQARLLLYDEILRILNGDDTLTKGTHEITD